MNQKRGARPWPSYRALRGKQLKIVNPKSYRLRRASEAAYRHKGPRGVCAYCGETAECIDHAVPAAWAAGATGLIAEHQLVKLSSCQDCNSRAGSLVDATFADRRSRIHVSLLKASRRALAVPRVDDDELDDLGPKMRERVLRQERAADRIRRRLVVLASLQRPEGVPAELFVAM